MRDAMVFDPAKMQTSVDWNYLHKFPCWRRQAIALCTHELIHLFEWVFICRFNVVKWDTMDCTHADILQDVVLKLLACKSK